MGSRFSAVAWTAAAPLVLLVCTLSMLGASAGAATVSTVVENVAVEVPGGSVSIKRIEVAGKGSSGADIVALFDRSDPKVFVERLRKLDAPSIVMPEVVAEYGIGDMKIRQVYRDVRLADVVHGRIGAASIGKIDILLTKSPRQPVRGGIAGVSARNLDLVLLARILVEPRGREERAASLVDYVSLKSLDIDVPREIRVEVERISASRLSARALDVPFIRIAAQADAGDHNPGPAGEPRMSVLHVLKDMADSVALGAFEMRGVHVVVPRGPLSYRIDLVALADAAQPRLGEIAIEGLSFSAADAWTSVGMISLRGLDVRAPLQRLTSVLGRLLPSDVTADPRAFAAAFDRLLVERVAIRPAVPGVMDPPNSVDTGRAAGDLVRLDRLELNAANPTNGIPGVLYGRADGLALSTKLSPRNDPVGLLGQLGYASLDVSTARFELAWNAATREIGLDKLFLDMPGVGSLEVAATLGGAGPELFAAKPATQVSAALGLRLQRVDIVARNAGVVEKAMSAIAADKHTTVEALRARMVQEAGVEVPERLGGGRAARAVGEAVARFLAQPQSLRVSASSPDGLGVADVQKASGPGDLLDRFDVTVSAN